MAALVDLEPQRSQSSLKLHLSQDTLQDMALLCEEPLPPRFNFEANQPRSDKDLVDLSRTSQALSVTGDYPTSAPTSLTPALPTRSSDAVIADLRRGRDPSSAYAAKIQEDVKRELDTNRTAGQIQHDSEEDNKDGSDAEDQVLNQPKPRKISERKRVQNAIFNSWFQSYAKKQAKGPSDAIDTDCESQSIKALVRQSESQQIITSPWEYQVELFERAKERNIIAVLDTGKISPYIR